jgi:hypothetical protein
MENLSSSSFKPKEQSLPKLDNKLKKTKEHPLKESQALQIINKQIREQKKTPGPEKQLLSGRNLGNVCDETIEALFSNQEIKSFNGDEIILFIEGALTAEGVEHLQTVHRILLGNQICANQGVGSLSPEEALAKTEIFTRALEKACHANDMDVDTEKARILQKGSGSHKIGMESYKSSAEKIHKELEKGVNKDFISKLKSGKKEKTKDLNDLKVLLRASDARRDKEILYNQQIHTTPKALSANMKGVNQTSVTTVREGARILTIDKSIIDDDPDKKAGKLAGFNEIMISSFDKSIGHYFGVPDAVMGNQRKGNKTVHAAKTNAEQLLQTSSKGGEISEESQRKMSVLVTLFGLRDSHLGNFLLQKRENSAVHDLVPIDLGRASHYDPTSAFAVPRVGALIYRCDSLDLPFTEKERTDLKEIMEPINLEQVLKESINFENLPKKTQLLMQQEIHHTIANAMLISKALENPNTTPLHLFALKSYEIPADVVDSINSAEPLSTRLVRKMIVKNLKSPFVEAWKAAFRSGKSFNPKKFQAQIDDREGFVQEILNLPVEDVKSRFFSKNANRCRKKLRM